MRSRAAFVLALIAVLSLNGDSHAADEALKSGPAVGQLIPGPFHPFNVNGDHADRPHCLVSEYGLRPVIAVFVRELPEPDKPIANLLKQLDELAAKNQAQGLRVFAVVLSDDAADPDKLKGLVQKLSDLAKGLDLKLEVLSVDTAKGPAEYGLNDEAEVTVLVYNQLKVAANFAFRKDALDAKDIQAILAAVGKMLPTAKKK